MTLDDLLTQWRGLLRDQAGREWYTDDDGTLWLNEAEVEACRRSALLYSSTADFCSIPVGVGNASYGLDPRIVLVQRATLAGATEPLWLSGQAEMDLYNPGWQARSGTPRYFLADYEAHRFLLSPTPSAVATLKLTVQREPLKLMAADSDQPEIDPQCHMQLLDWALFRAYSQHDADTYDPVKAGEHLARFEVSFGHRIDYADQAQVVVGYPREFRYGADARLGGRVLTKPKPPTTGTP
jgi:hypothetical protein